MRETVDLSEDYTNLAQEVIDEHEDLHWIRKADISIGYMQSSRGKYVFADCRKVPDFYRVFVPFDFLITVYDPNVTEFTDDQMKILLYHELLHVGMDDNGEDTKYIVRPHDIEEFRPVIDQYGMDWAKVR